MVEKILVNNLERYELSFLKLLMQIGEINYLEKTEAQNKRICKCAKDKILEKLQLCSITTIPIECELKKG